MDSDDEKVRRLLDSAAALEVERRKIEVFQRELPLTLQLVTQAIESIRQQMGCVETSTDEPVLEEFIPLKPTSSSSQDEENPRSCEERNERKPDWLRSVQLWNQEPEPDVVRKPVALDPKIGGGAFHPFQKEDRVAPPPVAAEASSTAERVGMSGGEDKDKDKEGHSRSQRKARRCWSPELHRRFLHALQQLGGSHAATPKQIRELMKVDGLTNDEVKSHLQKYRLHTRRPTPAGQSTSPQTPQFVVVGGIWVQPPEYTTPGAAAVTQPAEGTRPPMNGIYAPVASVPSSEVRLKNKKASNRSPEGSLHSSDRGSHEDNSVADNGATNSTSPSTSSSSQTTTVSPPY
ncbi:transcription factor NIGT1-like [Dioscorea cayenensis subsp. rotundata]|uniref:Transcription factor NIGT1-like n=1 Tax=Dioscorea cayennensis subsp. rotundata TaxID=55577 RepID=A0AB40BEQ0_DIOCR|nr:transcription factor NIGT1-like [Dioscorea cayenensis subsp. rotundata]